MTECGFDSQYVGSLADNTNPGTTCNICYVATFVKNKEDVIAFSKAFEKIVSSDKLVSLGLEHHSNNLLFIVLLLHDYYITNHLSEQIYNILLDAPFHTLSYNQLPQETKDHVTGLEIANLVEVIIALKEKKSSLTLQTASKRADIKSPNLIQVITSALDLLVNNLNGTESGLALPITWEYESYKQGGDKDQLVKMITELKNKKVVSPVPLFNRMVATYCLQIRSYFVSSGLIKPDVLMPDALILFLEQIFKTLGVRHSQHIQDSLASRKALRKLVGDYVKQNRTTGRGKNI